MLKPATFSSLARLVGAAWLLSLSASGCGDSGSPTPNAGGANLGGATGALGGAGGAGSPSAGSGGNEILGGQAIGGGGGQAPAGNGCIVPLYSYPDASAWTAIAQAKQAHATVDVVAIVNPDNGPGTGVDSTFTTGIAKLVAAGIVPIGYISTNYTKRGQAAVKADIDTWRAAYASLLRRTIEHVRRRSILFRGQQLREKQRLLPRLTCLVGLGPLPRLVLAGARTARRVQVLLGVPIHRPRRLGRVGRGYSRRS